MLRLWFIVTDEERGGEDVEDGPDGIGAEVEGESSQASEKVHGEQKLCSPNLVETLII